MIEIEAGSTNVYEDLGLPDAAEMRVKATLAAKIGEIIKHRHLTQVQAAEILGMPQPKLSGMLRGQLRGISPSTGVSVAPARPWRIDRGLSARSPPAIQPEISR